MKVSFGGNYLYKFQNSDIAKDFCVHYQRYKINTKKDMIAYGYDNYVHVIDGNDLKDFREAQKMNSGIVMEPFAFLALTQAFQDKAKQVDFSKLQ